MKIVRAIGCAVRMAAWAGWASLPSWAAEVTALQAETAAGNWVRRQPRRLTASFASSVPMRHRVFRDAAGSALYHVVDLEGGGFVVTSAHTTNTPIVCFSGRDTFDDDDRNPLKALLGGGRDATAETLRMRQGVKAVTAAASGGETAAEAAWRALLEEPEDASASRRSMRSQATVDDVRVAPLVQSQWGQSTWGDNLTPTPVFNYYTPSHYDCGCVVAAYAQVVRKWCHPTAAVTPGTYECYVDGAPVMTTMMGGVYDWSSMPLSYDDTPDISDAQCRAIGKLAYDLAVASQMEWSPEGAATYGAFTAEALRTRFGYASANALLVSNPAAYYLPREVEQAIYSSLDAGMPVVISLCTETLGHEAVVDGYGYASGTRYSHLNCGWSGSFDAWFSLGEEALSSKGFNVIDEVGYNIHPTLPGDTLSGRVLDASGEAVAGATVILEDPAGRCSEATSNDRGIYFFRFTEAGFYALTATSGTLYSATLITNLAPSVNAVVTNALGDNVAVYGWGRCGSIWGCDRALSRAADEAPKPPFAVAVAFDPCGGTVSPATRLYATLAAYGELPVPAREDHVFNGWFTSPDGGRAVTASSVASAEVTRLFAQWEREPDGAAGEPIEIAAPATTLTGTVSWSAKNLPKGLKIDAKTGVMWGTPTVPGTYVVAVTAKSGKTSESITVVVTVGNYADAALPLANAYAASVGVKYTLPLGEAFAGCTASGLPAGLAFAAKPVTDKTFGALAAGTVYGIASKACTNTVVFTKKESKSVTHKASARFTATASPAWAVGTFNGRLDDGSGSATLTIAANGKASGKIVVKAQTWTFAASGFEASEAAEARTLLATAKSGKLTAPVRFTIREEGVSGQLDDAALTLWRSPWKDAGATETLKPYVGLYTVQLAADETEAGYGYLSLNVDAKGACKATGKLPDGTAVSGALPLVWHDGALTAIWQMAPSAYKGGYAGGLLAWSEARTVASAADGISWVSLAPMATGDYGDGFARTLSAQGAWYAKSASLAAYYQSPLAFTAEPPTLDITVKTTSLDEKGKRQTASVPMTANAAPLACWETLTVSPNAKGTAFAVDAGKATKPVYDKATGAWRYTGANDAALTLSFTQATGVFKGSFTCWYDYVSTVDATKDPVRETAAHVSKKVSYEGIVVLGEPLRGFCLWGRTGSYVDAKTKRTKSYTYQESRPVLFR